MEDNALFAHSLRGTRSTTSAAAVGGSTPDPVKVDQHAVLKALRLSDAQKEAVLGEQELLCMM